MDPLSTFADCQQQTWKNNAISKGWNWRLKLNWINNGPSLTLKCCFLNYFIGTQNQYGSFPFPHDTTLFSLQFTNTQVRMRWGVKFKSQAISKCRKNSSYHFALKKILIHCHIIFIFKKGNNTDRNSLCKILLTISFTSLLRSDYSSIHVFFLFEIYH